jgi:hypothetical protein
MDEIPPEDADQVEDPDPPVAGASPPPYSDDIAAVGPLVIRPNEATRIRSAELPASEMGYVASEPETLAAFLADRGRSEVDLPDLETLAEWVRGDLDRPDFAPPTPRHQAVQTPLVTIERAAVREALGENRRVGAARLYLSPPYPTACIPWERVEAAVRTLLVLTGEEYDTDHVRCYDCGFDGIVVVYLDDASEDLLASGADPDAIREAVYIRPRILGSADVERQPRDGPNADVDVNDLLSVDETYQQTLIEREQQREEAEAGEA